MGCGGRSDRYEVTLRRGCDNERGTGGPDGLAANDKRVIANNRSCKDQVDPDSADRDQTTGQTR